MNMDENSIVLQVISSMGPQSWQTINVLLQNSQECLIFAPLQLFFI